MAFKKWQNISVFATNFQKFSGIKMNQLFAPVMGCVLIFTTTILRVDEKILVAVTIPPNENFFKSIGRNFVEEVHLVPLRQDIHTFVPKLSEVREKLKENAHFKHKEIAAEEICLDRLMSLNSLMNVITISKGIERVEIEDHNYSDEEGHHDEDKQSGTSMDPHIWLAPSNV